jgi:hypothetical protein
MNQRRTDPGTRASSEPPAIPRDRGLRREDRARVEVRIGAPAANSLYKLDTLIAALHIFRKGLKEEFAEYDRRDAELKDLKGE